MAEPVSPGSAIGPGRGPLGLARILAYVTGTVAGRRKSRHEDPENPQMLERTSSPGKLSQDLPGPIHLCVGYEFAMDSRTVDRITVAEALSH